VYTDNLIVPAIFSFIFGGMVGSFLNVCIYRIPHEKSVVRPGSHCPACGTPIRFYDNIPFISYFVLRGRCRACAVRISPRYVLVEWLTGVLFAVLFYVNGLSLELAVALFFVSLLIVISFIDLDYMIIPDFLSLGGLLVGLAVSFFRAQFTFVDSLLGVLLGGGVLFAIAKSYELLRKREGMGGGDIKLLGMIGAFWGWKGVLFALVAGSFAGVLVSVPLMLIKRKDGGYAVPFGPFLSFGALLYTIAGGHIINAVFHLL
jgi:leader peptidase (prepilin peptidase)/N-methyltransferase